MAYRRASLIELYLQSNFIEIGKTFFVDGLSAVTAPSSRSRDKVQFLELQKPRDLELDFGSGHTAYRRASVIDFYLHTKFR